MKEDQICKLLNDILAEMRKQTEVVAKWQGQDKEYHEKTLKKLGTEAKDCLN